jgi:hypothetical protein
MPEPFLKELQDFLINRCDDILESTEISPAFQQAEAEIDKLSEQLKPLLNEEGEKILLDLYMQHNYRMTEAAAAGYQKGFAEGIKFILYLSIS